MSWAELHVTLAGLVAGVEAPAGSGLRVDRVELAVPLETATGASTQGPIFMARVPHSRWNAGFLPAVQRARLVVEAMDAGEVLDDR